MLFVSHNMQAVSTLTSRCFLLRDGRNVLDGSTEKVIAAYLDEGTSKDPVFSAPASESAPSITRIVVETSEPSSTHIHGKPLRLTFDVTTPVAIRSATFSFQIVDSMLEPVVHLVVSDSDRPFCRAAGTYQLRCEIPRLRLYLGRYSVTAHLAEGRGGRHFQTVEAVCPFEVVMHGHERGWAWQEGICKYLEDCVWEVVSDPDRAYAHH